ncbi:hypothetical protein MNBD_GAMMA26-1789 [hydrothermal vent metagenome]|uniref:NHL repeat domain protein n=1 Tax=hydrothermal vent metagenome TaxID=652676 RepID=A0A3B1AY14_9ZZZZ
MASRSGVVGFLCKITFAYIDRIGGRVAKLVPFCMKESVDGLQFTVYGLRFCIWMDLELHLEKSWRFPGLRHRHRFFGIILPIFVFALLFACGHAVAKGGIPLGKAKHLFDIQLTPDGPLSLPSDVAVAMDNRVYIVDGGNHRVLAYGPEGGFLFAFGKRGVGQGEFMWPLGIDVDGAGLVYVADKENNRVQVFDRDGKYKSSFAVQGKKDELGKPIDVAVSAKTGLIFVTENTQHRILVFDSDGTMLGSFGKRGVRKKEFRYPGSIAVRNGKVYIVDILNTVIKIFDERGKYLYKIGEWGVLPGQFYRPKGVAVDSRGRIYVTDSYMDVVEVFSKEYKFEHILATGSDQYKFFAPAGIAIDSRGRLYVAEMLGNRVSVFKLY